MAAEVQVLICQARWSSDACVVDGLPSVDFDDIDTGWITLCMVTPVASYNYRASSRGSVRACARAGMRATCERCERASRVRRRRTAGRMGTLSAIWIGTGMRRNEALRALGESVEGYLASSFSGLKSVLVANLTCPPPSATDGIYSLRTLGPT